MDDALEKEVKAESGKEYYEIMQNNIQVGIFGSYDMGWSKRSSGHRYDSLSGHAFLVSCHLRKVIAAKITCKKCNTCSRFGEENEMYKPHKCPLNHEGSSKGMESEAALQIVCEMHEKHKQLIYIKGIISDDDSTMRALLKHPDNHPKGRLPINVPQPIFLANPGHRTKSLQKSTPSLTSRNQRLPAQRENVSGSK